MAEDISKFINITKKEGILNDLRRIFTNATRVANLSEKIEFFNEVSNTIVRRAIADKDLMNLAFDLLNKQTFVTQFVDIFKRLNDTEYLDKNVVPFVRGAIGGNKTVKNIIINSFQKIVRHVLTESRLKDILSNFLSVILNRVIKKSDVDLNISYGCSLLFNYTYLNISTKDNKFKFYYTKKMLIDSTQSKNDFLTYENCLNGYDKSKESQKYQIKPIYIVGKIIDRENQNRLKNSSYYEKYNYMLSFCFPQGKNISTNESLCTNEDYAKIIRFFNSFDTNMDNVTIRVFNITEEDLKGKPTHFLYFSLIIIISAINKNFIKIEKQI